MSTAPEPGYIPDWDMADRMRKTLRTSGLSVTEVADYFGVNRNTIGNWINGHVVPDLTTQRLWSLRFGVPLSWLQTGEAGPADGPGLPLPHPDSNRKPFDFQLSTAIDVPEIPEQMAVVLPFRLRPQVVPANEEKAS